jgi:hypothetical protein
VPSVIAGWRKDADSLFDSAAPIDAELDRYLSG